MDVAACNNSEVSDLEQDVILIFRAIERLVIIAGGFYCFWISYKFAHGSGAGDFAMTWEGFSIELKKIGPSIFFALFGCCLLIYIASLKVEIEVTSSESGESFTRISRFMTEEEELNLIARLSALSKNIHLATDFARQFSDNTITASGRNEFLDVTAGLEEMRPVIFEASFSTIDRSIFSTLKAECLDHEKSDRCNDLRQKLGSKLERMENFGK